MKTKELFWWAAIGVFAFIVFRLFTVIATLALSMDRIATVMENPPEVVVNIDANAPP